MKKIIIMAFPIILVIMLYSLNIIPHIYFTNDFFHIQKYNSHYDKDNDGIDDQIDILNRARNYIKNNSISLMTNLKDYKEWQGGDIVVFTNHIVIVSDKRNYMGVPVIIHHSNRRQLWYEEDTISRYKIIGHYRIS